jgi:membrane protein YdbS with pleckstrin-like domain
VGQLRQMRLCAKLSAEELKHLAGYVGLAHYPAGEILYRQGEMDPTLYILYEGEAVIRTRDEEGKRRPSGYLTPGNAVGETSLFLQVPRDATVEVVVDSNWFYLTRQDLEQFQAQHPGVQKKWTLKEDVRTRRELQRFPWMDPDEQFVLRDRRHWFFLAVRLILPSLLMVGALVVFLSHLVDIFALILLAIALLWTLWSVTDWANDYYIVTTKRVAHREKVFMIRETRDETPLDKIQNMNIARGLYGNLFGFGALIIDTAAAAGVTRVTFDHLGDPDQVQRLIFEQMSRVQAGERSETRRVIRDKLEVSVGQSIRPIVPQPAVPIAEEPEQEPPTPGPGQQILQMIQGIWHGIFWIEKRAGDQIIWRKHWIRLLRKTWMPILAILFLGAILAFFLTQERVSWWFIALFLVFLAAALGWFWWGWENWGNDLYIVTKDRIIDIEELPLGFRTQRTETTFDRVQNVSYEIPHPVATILNFGTVVIFTAGAVGQLDFEYVRDPKGVQAEVFRRLSAYEATQRRQEREQRWADLPEWFATYEGMRRL